MKTDPNQACGNTEQHFWWAFVHDAIAHPFMALTGWSALSLRFHDWTSRKAWPARGMSYDGGKLFSFKHPRVDHVYTTLAMSYESAREDAIEHFLSLSEQFGGVFTFDDFDTWEVK